jgi:ribosomal protein S18 acetylase RimI-like enzyme
MILDCRPMRSGEEDEVARQIRELGHELNAPDILTVTGKSLREVKDFVHVTVAERQGKLIGICVWMINFSTWRGVKGMYVCDLFIRPDERSRNSGEILLRAAAREAASLGATFVKLEVSSENTRPNKFYNRIGFTLPPDVRLMFLEPEEFKSFILGAPT